VVVLLLVALLAAPSAGAFPFIDDPGVVYALQVVSQLLRSIEQAELATALVLQKDIRGLLADLAFPGALFAQLHETLSLVQGIRDEILSLACPWGFSARTSVLRNLYLSLGRLCRRDFEGVWGTPVGRDADFEELRSYLGTLSTNMVSARVGREEGWRLMFPAMEKDAALVRLSPGDGSRDEAVSLAATALVADSNSSLKTQSLLLEQTETNVLRLEERRGVDMARFILRGAAGLDPWSGP
jgi:hypothetical protein